MTALQLAAKCALADLAGLLEENDPNGDYAHPGWKTMVEIYDALNGDGVDVSEWSERIETLRALLATDTGE